MIRTGLAIVGAGVAGLLTAYHLVGMGYSDIVFIERDYVGSGGSYRCATGIRASFTSREHIVLMKRAVELWPRLGDELDIPYLRGGYVWLLQSEDEVREFRVYVDFQNKLGVPTRIIDPGEVREYVPPINIEHIVAGVYDPLAGKADPFKTVLHIYKYLVDHGVRFYTGTRALKLVVENSRVKGVLTSKGIVEADKVLVAAGYGSRELMATAGIDLPTENIPKHALVTERYREAFKPLVIDWKYSSYIVQTFAGTFLIGSEIREEPDRPATNRIDYLYRAAHVWTRHFPWLRVVNILRYWTGYYVMTPDHHPILGPVEEIEGLYIATGFSGHGFMMAPSAGEAVAQWIIDGKPGIREAENLVLTRFREGRMIKEIAVFG